MCWLDRRISFFCRRRKGGFLVSADGGESTDKDTCVLDVKITPYALTGGEERQCGFEDIYSQVVGMVEAFHFEIQTILHTNLMYISNLRKPLLDHDIHQTKSQVATHLRRIA